MLGSFKVNGCMLSSLKKERLVTKSGDVHSVHCTLMVLVQHCCALIR